MYRREVQLLVGAMMVIEALFVPLAFYLAWAALVLVAGHRSPADSRTLGILCLLVAPLSNIAILKVNLYTSRWPKTRLEMVRRLGLAALFSMAGTLAGIFFLDLDVERPFILTAFGFLFALLVLFRLGVRLYLDRRVNLDRFCRRVLVVGSGRKADLVCKELSAQRHLGHRVVGFLGMDERTVHCVYGYPYLGEVGDLERVLMEQHVDEVLFVPARDGDGELSPWLAVCEATGKDYVIVPYLYDPAEAKPLRVGFLHTIPVLVKHMTIPNPSGSLYKRVLDYGVGVLGLALLVLMAPFVALAIKQDSPGPVIFRQRRVGRNGRVFTMYKFRTMAEDSEAAKADLAHANTMDGPMFKLHNDPRVTRVGRFLRRTSLDEFPQFINVLRGDMSLVGPRPPTPDEVEQYRLDHYRRLSFRPGITGLWQVSGRNEIRDFETIVRLDLEYIDGWRFMRDVGILFKTLLVVIQGRGAH